MTKGIPEDVLMLASAKNAGNDEIDEFLRCGGRAPGKRCFKRILKRIDHPSLYVGRRLTLRSRVIAWTLIALVALFFALLGYGSAAFIHDMTSGQDGIAAYFASFVAKEHDIPETASIHSFMTPVIPDAKIRRELVRSSLIYNVEFVTSDGNVYYLQKVRTTAAAEDTEQTENAQADDVFYVLVGEHRASVTKDHAGGGLFGISWSDEHHTYSITGCRSMEQAVRYAKSLVSDVHTQENDIAEQTAGK